MTYLKITSDGETLCLTCGEMYDGVLVTTTEKGQMICDRCQNVYA